MLFLTAAKLYQNQHFSFPFWVYPFGMSLDYAA